MPESRPAPAGAEDSAALPATAPIHPVAPASPPIRTVAEVRIGAVGDVLMHTAVKDCAAAHRTDAGLDGAGNDDGFGWLYAPIADLLSEPDLTFANLETPIAPATGRGSRSFVFNAPASAVLALKHAGVDLVNVANNHLFDQGRPGFLETLQRLEEAGMPFVGAGAAPAEAGPLRIEAKGLALAFLGYSQFFNERGNDCPADGERRGPPCLKASLLDPERAVAQVREAAGAADAVVVSLHWGVEYAAQPREQEVALAHRLADAGALVVLGHHPHVLQPIELYRRADGQVAVIAYSLGNFISNQSRNYIPGVTPDEVAAARDGALLRIGIARRDYGRGVSRVELAGVDYLPLWTENDTALPERRRDPAARPTIRVVAIDRALAEVRTALAAVPDPLPPERQDAYVALRRREALYEKQRAAIAAVLGEELERRLPAPAPPVTTR